MNIINIMNDRYSAKDFIEDKKLNKEQITAIEDILQLSPSSTNIQPWHFIIAISEQAKNQVGKSAHDIYSFNLSKIKSSSASIVFCSKVELTDEYLNYILEKEAKDGRFYNDEIKYQNHSGRSMFAYMHKYDYKDFQAWAEKQVYLNLGSFLVGIASIGLDAIAMEGLDFKILDEEFGLREKGYTSCVVVCVGWHSKDDFNKQLSKSRLPKRDILEVL